MTHSNERVKLSLSFFVLHRGLVYNFSIQGENNWNSAIFEFATLDNTSNRIILQGHFTYKVRTKKLSSQVFLYTNNIKLFVGSVTVTVWTATNLFNLILVTRKKKAHLSSVWIVIKAAGTLRNWSNKEVEAESPQSALKTPIFYWGCQKKNRSFLNGMPTAVLCTRLAIVLTFPAPTGCSL